MEIFENLFASPQLGPYAYSQAAREVNVAPAEKHLAISYEGREAEFREISRTVEEAGYGHDLSSGAEEVAED